MSGIRGNLTSRPLQYIAPLNTGPLTVSTVGVTIPSTWIPSGTASAWFCCSTLTGGVKMTFDNSPATDYGLDIGPGQHVEIRDNLDLIRRATFIRVTTVDGKLTFIPFVE